jgi:hypothetical protein
MVVSEITEWRPLARALQGEEELLKRKMEWKQLVINPDWKGAPTAKIFKYGFSFLEKDYHIRVIPPVGCQAVLRYTL